MTGIENNPFCCTLCLKPEPSFWLQFH